MPSPTLPPVPISAQAVRIGPLKGTAAMGGTTTTTTVVVTLLILSLALIYEEIICRCAYPRIRRTNTWCGYSIRWRGSD